LNYFAGFGVEVGFDAGLGVEGCSVRTVGAGVIGRFVEAGEDVPTGFGVDLIVLGDELVDFVTSFAPELFTVTVIDVAFKGAAG